jgi:DNA (cytosine-5)-methyltransferase 1
MTLTAIDLFCGAGGLTLGLKLAGFRVLGGVEIDPLACETYRANHPKAELWEQDIRTLPVVEVRERLGLELGDLDLLAGCPPCQGFSSIRTRRRGTKYDPRNELLFEFVRFVDGLRPRAVMMENVPGLADDERLARLVRRLRRRGYGVSVDVLDAADYGVAQRRRRLILLATRGRRPVFAKPAPGARTVRDAIGSLPAPGASGDPLHDLAEARSDRVRRLIAAVPADGGSRKDLDAEFTLPCHARLRGFFDVYGRMRWSEVEGTVSAPRPGSGDHPPRGRPPTVVPGGLRVLDATWQVRRGGADRQRPAA